MRTEREREKERKTSNQLVNGADIYDFLWRECVVTKRVDEDGVIFRLNGCSIINIPV